MTKITNTYVLDKAKMSVLLLIMLFTCPLAFAGQRIFLVGKLSFKRIA